MSFNPRALLELGESVFQVCSSLVDGQKLVLVLQLSGEFVIYDYGDLIRFVHCVGIVLLAFNLTLSALNTAHFVVSVGLVVNESSIFYGNVATNANIFI